MTSSAASTPRSQSRPSRDSVTIFEPRVYTMSSSSPCFAKIPRLMPAVTGRLYAARKRMIRRRRIATWGGERLFLPDAELLRRLVNGVELRLQQALGRRGAVVVD